MVTGKAFAGRRAVLVDPPSDGVGNADIERPLLLAGENRDIENPHPGMDGCRNLPGPIPHRRATPGNIGGKSTDQFVVSIIGDIGKAPAICRAQDRTGRRSPEYSDCLSSRSPRRHASSTHDTGQNPVKSAALVNYRPCLRRPARSPPSESAPMPHLLL